MEEITRNDFSYFQNEILKDIKSLEKKVNEKIATISKNFQNTALIIEQKYENANVKLDEILEILQKENIMGKINDKLDKFNSKIEETILSNNTKISSLQKDLSNAMFKYDKIFLNNISSPGLIGDGCPYPTMRSFLEYSNNKIKEFISSKERSALDFKRFEEWIKSTLDKYKEEINEIKNSNYQFLVKEIKNYDKRSLDKMNMVEDKLSFIKIENGRYNYNLNKKWEELEEKIKLFYTMNDNLINIYNNTRKEFITVKSKFNELSDYFKDIRFSKNNFNAKNFFDEISKKLKIDKKNHKINIETTKLNNILPPIEDFSKILAFKKKENNPNSSNVKTKQNSTKFIKKATFQIDNTGSLFNLKKNFYNNFQTTSSNLNIITESKIYNNYNKPQNVKLSFERKFTQNIGFSKTNFKSFNNNLLNEEKREIGIFSLKSNKSLKNIKIDNKIKDNIEEQNKENSSRNITSENKNNNNKNIQIIEHININKKEKNENKENKDIDRQDNKNIINDNETEIIKEIETHSNISNFGIIEQKHANYEKNNNLNNSNIKLLTDNKINNNNVSKISNFEPKINLDEELNKVNQKFDDLYDKMNTKIIDLSEQINLLIVRLNKVIFNKGENIKKINEIDFFVERKSKNIFLNNSGICLPYSSNKSTDDNYKINKKENNDKERDNSFNLINPINRDKHCYKGKLVFNNNINIKRKKLSNSRANSNDIMNSNKNKNNNNNFKNKRNDDYFIRMIDPLSINKIESYLIRKFTETN